MSRRSRRHRKQFACGHRGFGQYCHRCADRQHKIRLRKEQRQAWQATFESDAVALQKLPKSVVLKVRDILGALEGGVDYWQVAGKRLHSARRIIRIPITRRYRLLCRDDGKVLTPLKVVSHEDYNLIVGRVHQWLRQCLKEGAKE